MTTEDYIEKCGGLTQKSGNARIIVIRQNGAAVNAEDVDSLKPGDEIMVLPKYESKTLKLPVVFPPSSISWRWVQK